MGLSGESSSQLKPTSPPVSVYRPWGGGQSEWWRGGEVEGQRSGLTLRCEVITVQSQVVSKVAARRKRRDAFRKVGCPEWGWCRWGSWRPLRFPWGRQPYTDETGEREGEREGGKRVTRERKQTRVLLIVSGNIMTHQCPFPGGDVYRRRGDPLLKSISMSQIHPTY